MGRGEGSGVFLATDYPDKTDNGTRGWNLPVFIGAIRGLSILFYQPPLNEDHGAEHAPDEWAADGHLHVTPIAATFAGVREARVREAGAEVARGLERVTGGAAQRAVDGAHAQADEEGGEVVLAAALGISGQKTEFRSQGDSLRHELGHDGPAGFTADGFEVLADERAHRFATQIIFSAVVLGEALAEFVDLLDGRDGVARHVMQQ